jgi:hypothetical protein
MVVDAAARPAPHNRTGCLLVLRGLSRRTIGTIIDVREGGA